MKTDSSDDSDVAIHIETSSLHDLVEDIVRKSLPSALQNHHLVVNEIPEIVSIKTEKNIISTIVAGMLTSIMMHSKNSYIRVSAKIYSNVIVMHVRDFNIMNCNNQYPGLQLLHKVAKRIGGFVGITSVRHQETTLAFSFPNVEQHLRPLRDKNFVETGVTLDT